MNDPRQPDLYGAGPSRPGRSGSVCRSCGAPIRWRHLGPRAVPVDLASVALWLVPDGQGPRHELVTPEGEEVIGYELVDADAGTAGLGEPHLVLGHEAHRCARRE